MTPPILGIDPGIRTTGVSLLLESRVFKHKTLPGKKALSYIKNLHTIYGFDRAVIERPRPAVIYKKHMTKKNAVMTEAGRIKLAQNVGMNIQLTNEIVDLLNSLEVKVKEQHPLPGNTKWKADYWRMVFKFVGRLPSEHARDAAVLALKYETWVGWNLL